MSRWTKRALWATALIVAGNVTIGSCDPDWPYTEHRARWDSRSFADYRYTLQIQCFCEPEFTRPVVIDVVDGSAVSIAYADTGATAPAGLFEPYDLMWKLFEHIDQGVREAEYIEVRFNLEFGYPSYAFIDYSLSVADEEFGFTVTHVGPVE